MSGIYIHIPFCRKACHYCNFHFSTTTKYIPDIIEALCKEIRTKPIPSTINRNVETLYFGGGTPSLLTQVQLHEILQALSVTFSWDGSTEITIEANPEDITPKYLVELADLGFNRLSVGIQSFQDEDLISMNRNHAAQQSHNALHFINNGPISNYNIDLMFGLIGRSTLEWQRNIETALTYRPPHVSCYNLTIEEQTAYSHLRKHHKIVETSDVEQSHQFQLADNLLAKEGYIHYEISNYAQSGFEAVHNTNYWNRIPYISYGPSAHSFDGYCRFWNVANNQKYIRNTVNQERSIDFDHLSEVSRYNEVIMLGLRRHKGIYQDELNTFSQWIKDAWHKSSKRLISEGVLIENGDHIQLNRDWWYLSDDIAVQLFCEDETN